MAKNNIISDATSQVEADIEEILMSIERIESILLSMMESMVSPEDQMRRQKQQLVKGETPTVRMLMS